MSKRSRSINARTLGYNHQSKVTRAVDPPAEREEMRSWDDVDPRQFEPTPGDRLRGVVTALRGALTELEHFVEQNEGQS